MNFPKLDFYELLNDEQKRLVDTPLDLASAKPTFSENGYLHYNPFSERGAMMLVELLEANFKDLLNPINIDLPSKPRDMKFMKDNNYAPVAWKSHSAYFHPEGWVKNSKYPHIKNANAPRPCSNSFADMILKSGLYSCFTSDVYWRWLSHTLREPLSLFDWDRGNAIQISRYTQGDNCGLHNDYFGNKTKSCSYYDVHFSFAHNVLHQYMIFGTKALDGCAELMAPCNVGIYKLPIWHQVTPLIPDDPTQDAYRWLIISDLWYKWG